MLEQEWTLNSSDQVALQFQRSVERAASRDQLLKQTRLFEIRRIEDYLRINRPLLSQARRSTIEQKLELEKVAEKSTRSRARRDEYFVRYDYNPLSEKENIEVNRLHRKALIKKSLSALNLKPKAEDEEIALPGAVNDIKNNRFRRNNELLIKTSRDATQTSSKIKEKAMKLTYSFGGKHKPTEKRQAKDEELSFELILSLPDKNYYVQNQGPINIFEFMQGNHRSILNNGILSKLRFNFTSCVDKLQKHRIYIYRELSQLSRMLVKNTNIPKTVRLEVLNSYEMSISAQDIRFSDMISVSSGRFDPPLVYSILFEGNAQKDASPSHSLVDDDEDPINYQPNHHQKQTDYNYDLSAKQERDRYLMLENTPLEKKYAQRYHNIYSNVEKSVEEVRKIQRNTINDIKLHSKYQKIIEKQAAVLMEIDKPNTGEPDKLVRENKVSKNRQERLKIREMLKTIQLTNLYHQQLAPLVSKSKSKKKR